MLPLSYMDLRRHGAEWISVARIRQTTINFCSGGWLEEEVQEVVVEQTRPSTCRQIQLA